MLFCINHDYQVLCTLDDFCLVAYLQVSQTPEGGGVLYIFWVRGRAIGKGIDFHDFGIRNSIEFHDFGIRNGINFRNFAIGIGSGMHFRKIGIKSGIYF